MSILKYTYYVYLLIAVALFYKAINELKLNQGEAWVYFALAGAAVFMFFFRKKYSKRFEDHYKKS